MPKPLTIGVDVRDLRVGVTGTKTYLEEVCKEFKKMNSAEIRFHFLDVSIPVYTGDKKILKLVEHLRYQSWKQLVLPIKAFFKRCDVVFCTDNFVPIIHLGFKTIPVFHDAFFFESPEHYGKLWLWLYHQTAIPAANRSPYVITPSAYAKKQINHYIHIPNDKLIVVAEGPKTLQHSNEADEPASVLGTFGLSAESYILHVGSMYKRKNIPALIAAFGKVKSEGYKNLKLVLAGPLPANAFGSDHQLVTDAINNTGLQNDIILTGYLADNELGQLYKNALLYVFPSVNEGFGIPVLEAFSYNLPVLVANNTSLPEVGGDAVLQFDPFDIDDIAEKISSVLTDEGLRNQLIKKGQQRLKHFSWQKAAAQLVDVFKKAV